MKNILLTFDGVNLRLHRWMSFFSSSRHRFPKYRSFEIGSMRPLICDIEKCWIFSFFYFNDNYQLIPGIFIIYKGKFRFVPFYTAMCAGDCDCRNEKSISRKILIFLFYDIFWRIESMQSTVQLATGNWQNNTSQVTFFSPKHSNLMFQMVYIDDDLSRFSAITVFSLQWYVAVNEMAKTWRSGAWKRSISKTISFNANQSGRSAAHRPSTILMQRNNGI